MNNPEQSNPEQSSLYVQRSLTRRSLLAGAAALVGSLALPSNLSAEAFWSIEYTKRWFPAQQAEADNRGIEVLDAQYGALYLYNEVYREEFGEESGALEACIKWSDGLRALNIKSAGYCARTAMARIGFPEPSLATTRFNGSHGNRYDVPYPIKMALLTSLATQMVPLGFNEYTYNSNENRARLDSYASGEARWPFETNRPLPGETGEWFVVCDGVRRVPSGTEFRSDNFSGSPLWASQRLIKMTYDPYFPIEGQIPDALKGEVEFWQSLQSSKDIRIPVRRDLVMALVYGVPLTQAISMEDHATNFVMARQRKMPQTVALDKRSFNNLTACSTRCVDLPLVA